MQLAKRNFRSATVHFVLALWLVPGGLSAQSAQTAESAFSYPTEGDFIIKDFHFNDGEVLPELRLHYVTLGTPHRNSSGQIDNAVLPLHSTGSDATEFLDPGN
jgi:homoserine O-acetyltransferase